MFPITMRLFLLATTLLGCAESRKRWREELLGQARERILSWYTNPSLVEPPETRDGVALRLLRQDQPCGGDVVPVTFAEFDVKGARPIDVFNTMLDTPKQKAWNPQLGSVKSLGDWANEGARAWANVFKIPIINDREFLQWQVADANVTSEEFWLVFSTQNNAQLRASSPIEAGATEAQNCLGAYHITKHPEGAHVIITQHVNPHPFLPFPMHEVLKLFPAAWAGTLNFVHQMSDESRNLAKLGSARNFTDAPPYMLRDEPNGSPALSIVSRAETFQPLQPTKESQGGLLNSGTGISLMFVVCACFCFAAAGFSVGRFTARKVEAARAGQRFNVVESRATSFDTNASFTDTNASFASTATFLDLEQEALL